MIDTGFGLVDDLVSVTGVIIKEGDCCQSVQPDLVPEGAQVTPKDIGG
jgi:hypothetical protein